MSELSALTTLRVGGPARTLVTCRTEGEVVDVVRACDASGEPVLVVGGGSNLVVGDDGFAGTVILVRSLGIEAEADGCAGAWVTVAAGEPWDDVAARAVAEGWVGLEALAGIPGLTGATPIQNVGAYGAEVADTIARVRAYDRLSGEVATLAVGDCGFGYRTSRFKVEASRHVVLSVTFQLPLGSLSAPVRYAELAALLGVAVGERAPLSQVRDAVLDLRRRKGMVLDDTDHDTWSVGSFFTNPVVDARVAPEGAPQWPQPDGRVKVSAAWLVERAGFPRGFTLDGRAAVSGKHALALTNRGDASAGDVLRLAQTIRDGVRDAFGITLVPEPSLIACALD